MSIDLIKMAIGTVTINTMYQDTLKRLFNAKIEYYDLTTREKLTGFLTQDIEKIDKTIYNSLEFLIKPFF